MLPQLCPIHAARHRCTFQALTLAAVENGVCVVGINEGREEKLQFDAKVEIFQKDTRASHFGAPKKTLGVFRIFYLHEVHTLITGRTGEFSDLYGDESRIRPPYDQTLPDFPVNLSRSAIDPSTVHGTFTNSFQVPGVDSQNEIGTWQKHIVGKKYELRCKLLTAIRVSHCPTRRPYPHPR
jgi:hypothetical protein